MEKSKLETILNEASEARDMLNLKANLSKAEAKDGFSELESKYESLKAKSEKLAAVAGDTAEEVRVAAELGLDSDSKEDRDTALELAAEELKEGYEKIKKLL
ncbi:MAG: hypothetical protein GQ531_02790 [Sulfurovum sp.]|nr:hypothetical protein [Sulfurovum sp.]